LARVLRVLEDDPGFFERTHLDRNRPHRHAQGHAWPGVAGAGKPWP
jgi:hypothetical protein